MSNKNQPTKKQITEKKKKKKHKSKKNYSTFAKSKRQTEKT